tara:strand:+ start:3933 stop:4379 length:447 start_codon:yes stop_codon:yes gene_type:complete
MEDRRSFLKTACKPMVLAMLGIPILEACSAEETASSPTASSSSLTPTSTQKKEPIIIDLSNGLFSDLTAVGGWMNYREEDLLLVRITDDEIRAFDNSCPHQGNRDRWEYDGSNFICGHHSNSYSNSCTGSLRCFDTKIENGILTITFD